MRERIDNRKQYIEQIRQSFRDANAEESDGRASSYKKTQDEEDVPRGYFKLRLMVAIALFLAFVVIWKTGWSYGGIDANTIQSKIQTNLTLPDSVSKLTNLFTIFEE